MISLYKPVKSFTFIIVLLFITGICLCISPDAVYASSVDPLGYGSAHFPFEPSVSDSSGYFVLEDSHGNDVMFAFSFLNFVDVESVLSAEGFIDLSISGTDLDIYVSGDAGAIEEFSLYMFEGDSVDLVFVATSLGGGQMVYSYSFPYSITGFAFSGPVSLYYDTWNRSFDAISLSFGSDDPYPELLYLYYQEIQGDLYETFYPIVTAWLESIGGNTSQMQTYLQQITIQLTNYLSKSTLANGDLTLLGYTESIDATLKELLEAFESSGGSGSESTDGLLQSILTFLSGNDLRAAIHNGIGSFFTNPQGSVLFRNLVSGGVTSGINNSDIPSLLTELTDIVSELNAEYEYWSAAMNDYRYADVNDRGKSVFQQLWQALISPFIAADTSGAFSYSYVDEYGDPQTGYISVIRLFQELIFSDTDDGNLDYNYFNNWESGYLP